MLLFDYVYSCGDLFTIIFFNKVFGNFVISNLLVLMDLVVTGVPFL